MKQLYFITATALTLYLFLFFPVAAHADGIPAPSGQKTIVFATSDVPLTPTQTRRRQLPSVSVLWPRAGTP